jgi:signal transduction histidine kinase
VTIRYETETGFLMILQDNGVGFDVEDKKKKNNSSAGVGLKSMVNRASLIGASLDIQSLKDQGTTIKVALKPSSHEYFQNS